MNSATSILIYTPKLTARIEYTLRHCLEEMLGYTVQFTTIVEEFIASTHAKFSYARKPLGSEFFIEKYGLLDEVGFNDIEISVGKWQDLPCFFKVSAERSLPFDIFSASFYLLSRYEEYQPYVKDDLGAFPVAESLAFKHDFLQMPLVDLWVEKFNFHLQQKFNQLSTPHKQYKQCFIIAINKAYKFANKNLFRQLVGLIRDVLLFKVNQVIERSKVAFSLKQDPYDTHEELLGWLHKNKHQNVWFFQLGDFSRSNRNISHHSTQYHQLIKHISDFSPTGLLLSYEAVSDEASLKKEIKRWEKISHQDLASMYITDPSLGFPEFYLKAQSLGLHKDYSLGYLQTIGFRASTCFPFYFYDLNLEQTTPLQMQPYAIHFDSIKKHENKHRYDEVITVKSFTKKVSGSLNIILENTIFTTENKVFFNELNTALSTGFEVTK